MSKRQKRYWVAYLPLWGGYGTGAFGKLTEGGPGLLGLMAGGDKKTDEEKRPKNADDDSEYESGSRCQRMAAGGRARNALLMAYRRAIRALY